MNVEALYHRIGDQHENGHVVVLVDGRLYDITDVRDGDGPFVVIDTQPLVASPSGGSADG